MALFIASLVVISMVIAGMAVGVLLGGKPIKGSCGGMSAIGMDTACDICGGSPKDCKTADTSANAPRSQFYDASR